MIGEFTWGDVHHPGLSQTAAKYDGRWLFVNDNANNRIARIDLRDFKTQADPRPDPELERQPRLVVRHREQRVRAGRDALLGAAAEGPLRRSGEPTRRNSTAWSAASRSIQVDGELTVGWQILTPPFNWDLGSTGKGPSSGWAFWTSYNSEMAHETLEANSTQGDRDYAAVVNWRAAEQAVKDGKATMMDGVPVIDPAKVPGVIYFLPVPKSPHGIDTDPSGRWIAASGKLQPVTSVFDFEKIKRAIDRKHFDWRRARHPGDQVRSRARRRSAGRPRPAAHAVRRQGQRLHVALRRVGGRQVDVAAVEQGRARPEQDHRSTRSRCTSTSATSSSAAATPRQPYGKYLVAMNKLSKGRHLSVGPSQPERSQLIDITGNKMSMLYEAYTEPEPHFAQILKADQHRADRGLSEGREHQSQRGVGRPRRPASRAPATRST